MIYDDEKIQKLMTGSNQDWYNFKQSLIEHISCHPSKSAGQFHLKAKQYAVKEKKRQARICEVDSNLVAAAIAVCKMKAAASSYETMVCLLSFCGAEIGDIGHGR